MSKLISVTTDTFEAEVLQSSIPVLVDFYGDYCGPCQAMKPVLGQVAEGLGDRAKVVMVDVVVNEALTLHYGISAVPTLIVFRDGEEVHRFVGMKRQSELVEALAS